MAELVKSCEKWAVAETPEAAHAVALTFYTSFPSIFSSSAYSSPPLAPTSVTSWDTAAAPLLPGETSSEIFELTGRCCPAGTKKNRTTGTQCIGKKLLFFTLFVPSSDPSLAPDPVRVRVDESILHSGPLSAVPTPYPVPVTSALLAAALNACPSCVRVTGAAGVSKCGKYKVLSATCVRVFAPKPSLATIAARLHDRRSVPGMWRKAAGMYTEEGGSGGEEVSCDKCGTRCGGTEDYDEHCEFYHGSARA